MQIAGEKLNLLEKVKNLLALRILKFLVVIGTILAVSIACINLAIREQEKDKDLLPTKK